VFAHGNWRAWASFTATVLDWALQHGRDTLDHAASTTRALARIHPRFVTFGVASMFPVLLESRQFCGEVAQVLVEGEKEFQPTS
jgi:hypothetical protein